MKNLFKLFNFLVLLIFVVRIGYSQSDNYNWSINFGGGIAKNINFNTTNDWYGNPSGPEIHAGIGYKKIHLNATFRYCENTTRSDLAYGDYVIYENTPFKINYGVYSISYEQEIIKRFFIEPYIGYLQNYIATKLIDPDGNEIEFSKMNGASFGSRFIKYIKFMEDGFIGLYFNINYNLVDYQQINPSLTNNTLGYSMGVLIKGVL